MIKKSETKKRLILYAFFSILLGWSSFLLIPLLKLDYGALTSSLILMLAMFTPALSNIIVRLITKEGFKNMYLKPNFKGNLWRYLLLFFFPNILIILSGLIYFLIFPSILDKDLNQIKALMEGLGSQAISPSMILIVQFIQLILIGPIVNIIPTLGEELGWQGYLLPKLREFFSDRISLIIMGAFWGFWHLPVIVMGHNYGLDYFGYPWLGILAMIIFCIVLGIIEGYFTIKMESVIPAAMIHSAVNAGAALPILISKEGYNTLLGPAITGLVGGIPFILLAIILFILVKPKMKNNNKIQENENVS